MTICFLLASVPLLAHAGNAPSQAHSRHAAEVLEQCGEHSQAGMRDCLERKVRESTRTLAEAEATTRAAIRQWDEEPKFVAQAGLKLRASGSEFARYRAAHCAFVASMGGGAILNALELRRLACVFALNAQRTEELTRLAAELPGK
ncbi:DUF1311 domain-containing protein [Massilia dura]|uniref:DUF1311 domain-containing protein n=1 Tax=Pseudoduganella dura TaxID=321982 RepID=A0A6I3XGR9_9BURK|nr:lysozyme inhibitor LprI family protein [Pseudoduganella dura]MUI13583.1 DUF1311 domain-containing protein [Pseudoduganella dura]